MAKKNESNEGAPIIPVKEVKENLMPVVALSGFTDGNLAEHFSKYGYGPEWPKGELRRIPAWLWQRCVQSGGEFELRRA